MRNCYNHPGMGAVTVCEACGRGICAACIVDVNDHVYCRDCAVEERKNMPEPAPSDPQVSEAPPQPEPAPSAPVVTPAPAAAAPEAPPAPEPAKQAKPTEEKPAAPAAPVAMVPSTPAPVAPRPAASTPAPIPPASTAAGKPGKKESLIAALLSLVVPGLGQVYDGQTKKGIVLAVIFYGLLVIIFACVVIFTLMGGIGAICCAPGLLFPALVLLYAVYDAYNSAEKINRGEEPKDWL